MKAHLPADSYHNSSQKILYVYVYDVCMWAHVQWHACKVKRTTPVDSSLSSHCYMDSGIQIRLPGMPNKCFIIDLKVYFIFKYWWLFFQLTYIWGKKCVI